MSANSGYERKFQVITATVSKSIPISRYARVLAAVVAGGVLAGCTSGVDEALGLGKNPPDEFAILTKAPLTIPPDFALRPPRPGAAARHSRTAQQAAENVLYQNGEGGGVATPQGDAPGTSAGEAALLVNAGAVNASPDVRGLIESEYQSYIEANESFADRIIFWQDRTPQPYTVDAPGEVQRLRQNDALGRPITVGETPNVEPDDERGLLEGAIQF